MWTTGILLTRGKSNGLEGFVDWIAVVLVLVQLLEGHNVTGAAFRTEIPGLVGQIRGTCGSN